MTMTQFSMKRPAYFLIVISLLLNTFFSLSRAESNAAPTEPTITEPETFSQCVQNLAQTALDKGISASVVDRYQETAQFVPRVIELDRKQPEFTETFTNYINRRVSGSRIQQGQSLLKKHGPLLNKLQKQYGVPGRYLVAFWGLETNYGSYTGKMSTLNSLTTLACDERRSQYFTEQLMAALTILDTRGIIAHELQGSWAGALGNMQFMPSVFLKFAQDGDGDGNVDLWGSIPDALTSAAAFLNSLGWTAEQRWGREVLLPENFPYHEAGLKNPKPLSEWRKLGITNVYGASLPNIELNASLIIPAGHQGPKFLVYSNFHTIMGWNRSEFYAIAVGHLADRLTGVPDFKQPPPSTAPRLTRDMVKKLQASLMEMGFDTGEPDGILGPQTRQAIREYQQKNQLIADGFPNETVLAQFEIEPSQ